MFSDHNQRTAESFPVKTAHIIDEKTKQIQILYQLHLLHICIITSKIKNLDKFSFQIFYFELYNSL